MKPDIKEMQKMINNIQDTKKRHPDWTIRDYEKEAPETLKIIKEYTPEVYNQMYNAYYKKK